MGTSFRNVFVKWVALFLTQLWAEIAMKRDFSVWIFRVGCQMPTKGKVIFSVVSHGRCLCDFPNIMSYYSHTHTSREHSPAQMSSYSVSRGPDASFPTGNDHHWVLLGYLRFLLTALDLKPSYALRCLSLLLWDALFHLLPDDRNWCQWQLWICRGLGVTFIIKKWLRSSFWNCSAWMRDSKAPKWEAGDPYTPT